MEKKDSKNVKQHPAFVYRAVSDFYYAFQVMLFGTKYLDSGNKLVVRVKHELTEAMNNFSSVMANVLGEVSHE